MPILNVQLNTSCYAQTALADFMQKATAVFAETLEAPTDRIRVYLHDVPPQHMLIGGKAPDAVGGDAPFFQFYLLAGRPPEHRDALLVAFTDLLVECLGVERSVIRGFCSHIDPNDWSVAGVPAGQKRAQEIAARAQSERS